MANDPLVPGDLPPEIRTPQAESLRKDVIEGINALVEELGDDGWKPIAVPWGQSLFLGRGKRRDGLSVTIPTNRFEEIAEVVHSTAGEEASLEVYRTESPEVVSLTLVVKDGSTRTAVVVPIYFSQRALPLIRDLFAADGHFDVHLRTIADETVQFRIDDPDLVLG